MNVILFVGLVSMLTYTVADELQIDVLYKPDDCGERISKAGDKLKMHYTGKLDDGSTFDSSLTRNQPFEFQLGVGQVIKGWDEGLKDMCIGEKRQLTIPSDMGYGKKGAGDKIPADSTLHFEVELLDISDGPQPKNVFKDIDTDGDGLLSQDEVREYMIYMGQQLGEIAEETETEDKTMALVKRVIAINDKDGDGFISENEFHKSRKPKQPQAEPEKKVTETPNQDKQEL